MPNKIWSLIHFKKGLTAFCNHHQYWITNLRIVDRNNIYTIWYWYSWLRFNDLYTKQCFYAHLKVDTSLRLTHSHFPFFALHACFTSSNTLEYITIYNEYPKSSDKRKLKDLMYREKLNSYIFMLIFQFFTHWNTCIL